MGKNSERAPNRTMIRRRYNDEDIDDRPRLIRKSADIGPIRYSPQRHRRMLIVLSLLIAFVLGLIIMPSNLKKNAMERVTQSQKTTVERHSSSDYVKSKSPSTHR